MDGRKEKDPKCKTSKAPLRLSVTTMMLSRLTNVGNIRLIVRPSGEHGERIVARLLGMGEKSSGTNTAEVPVRLAHSEAERTLKKGRTVVFTDGNRVVTFSVDTVTRGEFPGCPFVEGPSRQ